MGGGTANEDIQYSEKYYDAIYEYRHVILPHEIAKLVPRTHLLTESEWRNLGVQQSPGWINFMTHHPEPHILIFRRKRTNTQMQDDFIIEYGSDGVPKINTTTERGFITVNPFPQ